MGGYATLLLLLWATFSYGNGWCAERPSCLGCVSDCWFVHSLTYCKCDGVSSVCGISYVCGWASYSCTDYVMCDPVLDLASCESLLSSVSWHLCYCSESDSVRGFACGVCVGLIELL